MLAASSSPHEFAAEAVLVVAPMILRAEAAAARAEAAAARADAAPRGGTLELRALPSPRAPPPVQASPTARLPAPTTAPKGAAGDSKVYIEELLPPQDVSRTFFKSLPTPWIPLLGSFVSSGSHSTTIAQGELLVNKVVSYCGLPVSMGAGYEASLVPLSMVSRYQLWNASTCGMAGKNEIRVTMLPQGRTLDASLGAKDEAEFLAHMAKHAAPSRRAPLEGSRATPTPAFTFVSHCGKNTKTLSLRHDGMVELSERQLACTTLYSVDAAHALDFTYLRAVSSGLGAQLCLGKPEPQLELSFLGDSYVLAQPFADSAALAEGTAAVLRAVLQRQPAVPEVVLQGVGGGSLALGADFIVSTTESPSCHPLLASSEVVTVRTRDVSHLTATLPSWQNALLVAIRDIKLVEMSRRWYSLCMKDPPLCLSGWPLACLDDMWALTLLYIKMFSSILAFLMVFLFRKTALVLGGPGPAKQVAFYPSEQPEALLRSVAARIAGLQEQAMRGHPGDSMSGADKAYGGV